MKVDQKVRWDSQGKGSYKEKTGTIVRVVRDGEIPYKVGLKEFPNHVLMFDGFKLPGTTKKAYLVEVIKGPRAKPRLYLPFPDRLKKGWSAAGARVGLSEKDAR